MFVYTGENLTYTFRTKLFRGIIYKHIGWFDNKDRAPGILSNILSEDISCLNGLTTESISLLLEAILSFLIGIILAFIYSWKISFVTLAISPLVMIGGLAMAKI